MTHLVTGANGFVGAAIVRALLDQGSEVCALVRQSSDCRNLKELQVRRVVGDILDVPSLRSAMTGSKYVIHAAADYRLWTRDPDAMHHTNIQGSLNVLNVAAEMGVTRMVYTSTVATLGTNKDRSPANEATPVSIDDMVGPYKRSKFLAEERVKRRAKELGYPIVIVNPSTPIGPGDIKPTPTGRIIVDAMLGRIPAFVDTGLNVVHVDDVARGHLLALERGEAGQRYVLGGTDLSLREILTLVAARSGRKPPTVRLPRWSVYPAAYVSEFIARFTAKEPRVSLDGLRMAGKYMYFSSEKARRELGYIARAPEQAIDDAIAWFRAHAYV